MNYNCLTVCTNSAVSTYNVNTVAAYRSTCAALSNIAVSSKRNITSRVSRSTSKQITNNYIACFAISSINSYANITAAAYCVKVNRIADRCNLYIVNAFCRTQVDIIANKRTAKLINCAAGAANIN